MMKRIFCGAVFLFFATIAMAQYRPTYIIYAGYQGTYSDSYNSYEDGMVSGFRVGAAVDFSYYKFGTGEFSIQPGLYFSNKGAHSLDEGSLRYYYLEMPILLNARFGVSNNMDLFVNAGPCFAYGTSNSSPAIDSSHIEDKWNHSSHKENHNPLEFSTQVGGGLEYKGFQAALGVQFEPMNIVARDIDSRSPFDKNFFVMFGYRF